MLTQPLGPVLFNRFLRTKQLKEVSNDSLRRKETESVANFMVIFSWFLTTAPETKNLNRVLFFHIALFFFLIRPKYLLSFNKKKYQSIRRRLGLCQT